MNSRDKGKRGERQWRDELRAAGYAARRGQQFAGSPESPDVVCEALPWAHFEVKAVERLNIEDAMEQARRDCGTSDGHLTLSLSAKGREGANEAEGKIPIVAHRRRRRRWLVTMEAEHFFRLLRGELPPDQREGRTGGTSGTNRTEGTGRERDENDFLRRDAEGGPRDAGETDNNINKSTDCENQS